MRFLRCPTSADEPVVEELQKLRISTKSFKKVKVIGRGGFGEVQLVRDKETSELLALKCMSKAQLITNGDVSFWAERNIMLKSNSEWIVKLVHAFQDEQMLYMAMEYLPGGNLLTVLENFEVTEQWARIYVAELVLALDVVHEVSDWVLRRPCLQP